MAMLSFRDKCTITRESGGYDEYDNPITPEVIYSGKCDFQPGGQTSQSIVTHNDVVYLPEAVMALKGDVISVVTILGRERYGRVKLANDLGLDITGDWITEIEIEQGRGE